MSERLYPRVSLSVAGRVRTGSQEIKCRLVSLSARGMCLETGKDQELGRFVRVTAELGEGAPRLDLDAIVHSREKVDGKSRWGVEFHDASPHQVSRIADYVRERLALATTDKTLEAAEAVGRSPEPRQPPPTDPEVLRLYQKALENIA